MDQQTNAAPETTAAAAEAQPAATEPSRDALTARQWLDDDLSAGKIDATTHAAALAELGFGEQAAAAAAADPVAEYLSAEGFAPAKAAAFKLPPMLKDGEPFTPEIQAADAAMRAWLEGARFTREIGNSVAAEVAKVTQAQMNADDTTREIYARGQVAQLERMWGPEKAAERIALAQQLVRELDARRPGLVRFLNDTGAGNSAFVIAQVAMHAERLMARPDDGKQQ